MENMKLIMESFREYTKDIENTGFVYLFEGDESTEVSFDDFFSSHIDCDRMLEEWERSFNYELGVLEEQIVAEGAIANVAAKVNDWFLEKSVQAMQLAQRSFDGALRAAATLLSGANRLAEKYPRITKMLAIVGTLIVVAAILGVFNTPEALASIKDPSTGGVLSDAKYKAARGFLDAYSREKGSLDTTFLTGDAIKVLDMAHEAKSVVDLDNIRVDSAKLGKAAVEQIIKLAGEAAGGDEDANELLMKWHKVGSLLRVQ
tara:strand:- start:67 stop:846 length:780 start_codon:yes stop_codon:yes gene_type:complete